MTAEIIIMNRSGIALAADSAVTLGQDRVWKNTNKLFHISAHADIGAMIYGNGDHCGLPWEVLIKGFRKQLGEQTLAKTSDYAERFIEYLDEVGVPDEKMREVNVYSIIIKMIVGWALQETKDGRQIPKTKGRSRFIETCEDIMAQIVKDFANLIENYPFSEFAAEYQDGIVGLLEEEAPFKASKAVVESAVKLCFEACRRNVQSEITTGIVFAGFGENEFFPAVHAILVDGVLGDKVRAWSIRERNFNDPETAHGGVVMPFAQDDIAHLFMEGTMLEHLEFVERTLETTLHEKSEQLIKAYVPHESRTVELALQKKADGAMTEEFRKVFQKFRNSHFVQPMMKVINSLPKEEMAAVAEALVETTSLRRKMDSKLETVGGPVDVAVISKSDGFIWIKRKHYFDPKINADFFKRRIFKDGESKDGT